MIYGKSMPNPTPQEWIVAISVASFVLTLSGIVIAIEGRKRSDIQEAVKLLVKADSCSTYTQYRILASLAFSKSFSRIVEPEIATALLNNFLCSRDPLLWLEQKVKESHFKPKHIYGSRFLCIPLFITLFTVLASYLLALFDIVFAGYIAWQWIFS